MEITVERLTGDNWRIVDPALVFNNNDQVRFRFRSTFGGYLYVMNQGTGGEYQLLFPTDDTGKQNQVEPGKEYVVPATEGSFRVTGPAGQDIVYWLVTPVKLPGSNVPQPQYVPLPPPPRNPSKAAASLTPRCDDSLLRARGDCIDTTAGPRAQNDGPLPENLAKVPGISTRELIVIKDKNKSVISSATPLRGPVVYEFRLAHR
jgi:hypothetical protein